MTFDQYRKEVVRLACEQYKKPVCGDSIRQSYDTGVSINEAADIVVMDSEYLDIGC